MLHVVCFSPTLTSLNEMKLLLLAALSSLFGGQSFGQNTTQVLFQVTSVRSQEAKDYCEAGKCSATRFTVEGYVDVKGHVDAVEYVLECVELIENEPKPYLAIVCSHVHAHEDYAVKIGDTYISFSEAVQKSKSEPIYSSYAIVKEKEVIRHAQ
jgi:hypothetical protein